MSKLKFLHLLTLLFLCLNASAQEYRDVIFLKNGSIIKGFYKSIDMNDSLRMQTIDGGMLVCPMSDVQRIAKEKMDIYVKKVQDDEYSERQWRTRGYSGSVEYEMTSNLKSKELTTSSIYTTHGYQLSRIFYVGAGFGIKNYNFADEGYNITKSCMPLHLAVRAHITKMRVAPLIEIRGGYSATGIYGFFLGTDVGVDFNFTPHFGAWMKVGYNRQHVNNNIEGFSKDLYDACFKIGVHF